MRVYSPNKITYVTGDDKTVKLEIDHTISLELTINIEGNNVSVRQKEREKEDENPFIVPDFKSGNIVDFGKEVK